MEDAVAQGHSHARAAELVVERGISRRQAQIALDQQMHPAACAARRDGKQPLARRFAEARWKPSDDEKTIFLGDGASLLVVFSDVRKLVAEIHLDDFLDVLV